MTIFKTAPFAHQLEAFELSKDAAVYALFMEQGTGKSKVLLDTVAHLYLKGEIDGLLVAAPNGVHTNWVNDEIPRHLSDAVPREVLKYKAGAATTKRFQRSLEELLAFNGLAILAINIDALITPNGKATLKKFFTRRKRVLYAIDESTDIKNPTAQRTKVARGFAKHATYKRILTGTPTGNGSPLDLYSQMAFLDPKILGHTSFTAFKHEYADWETRLIPGQRHTFLALKGYKNLDRLQALLKPYSYRKTRAEALDLPPKLYNKFYFELSKEQARHYEELRSNFYTEMSDGTVVTAPLALQRLLRQQQATCGYFGSPSTTGLVRIEGGNPRLDALKKVVELYPGPTIIWARFSEDINLIMAHLGDRAVRYDGDVSQDERDEAKAMYIAGEADYFVGNPKAGGRGLTLTRTQNVIYYSNYFGLETRQQSEDRAHRIGLEHPVNYIDLIAEGTVDEKIITTLREGRDVANAITGDNYQEWI